MLESYLLRTYFVRWPALRPLPKVPMLRCDEFHLGSEVVTSTFKNGTSLLELRKVHRLLGNLVKE